MPETESQTKPLPKGICPLPWAHFSVNTDTSLRVCCNTDHGGHVRGADGKPVYLKDVNSVTEAMNSPNIKKLRSDMLKGERPAFCQTCYKVEDSGGTSIRQLKLGYMEKELRAQAASTAADGTAEVEISSFDLSLGNDCNLKCRMCTPPASYGLSADFDTTGVHYDRVWTANARTGWKDEERITALFAKCLPTVREVLTTGGEPLLSRVHLRLMEYAVTHSYSKNISLCYHTNLTVVPERLMELWSHFRHVSLHASIEATGPLNEYIRYPSKWDQVKTNFESFLRLTETAPVSVEVHSCFQALSALRIPELLDFLAPYASQCPGVPHFIWLDYPDELSALMLPPELRIVARLRVQDHLEKNMARYREGKFAEANLQKIDNLLAYLDRLNAAPWIPQDWNRFLDYTGKFDRVRNQSVLSVLPELQDCGRIDQLHL